MRFRIRICAGTNSEGSISYQHRSQVTRYCIVHVTDPPEQGPTSRVPPSSSRVVVFAGLPLRRQLSGVTASVGIRACNEGLDARPQLVIAKDLTRIHLQSWLQSWLRLKLLSTIRHQHELNLVLNNGGRT